MSNREHLQREYDRLIAQGTKLAGELADVSQRAAVYHHMYEDSGRNHIFPLIAAHGALWSRGYFSFGMRLGNLLAWQFIGSRQRQEMKASLVAFANAFREINRRVCVDTYASYHFTMRYGDDPEAIRFVAPHLVTALNQLHTARRQGIELTDQEKRRIYETHFLNEQETVVGPRVQQAIGDFKWPLMKQLSLRPIVKFAYFPRGKYLWFRQFDRTPERIERGLCAFDLATSVGWNHVEASLRDYNVLPSSFFANSLDHFAAIRRAVLQISS